MPKCALHTATNCLAIHPLHHPHYIRTQQKALCFILANITAGAHINDDRLKIDADGMDNQTNTNTSG